MTLRVACINFQVDILAVSEFKSDSIKELSIQDASWKVYATQLDQNEKNG